MRPVLLSNSLEAVSEYRKATDSLITNVKKFSEANFWLRYKRLLFAYEHQWTLTEASSKWPPENAPKIVRKAWKELESGTYADAINVLTPTLSRPRITEKQAPVFRFVLSIARAGADYGRAVQWGWKFLESGLATTEDSLVYADCLTGFFAFDEAMAVQDMIEQGHSGDSLMIARLRYLRGHTLRARMDTQRAVAPLIEAAYLLHELQASVKRDALLRLVTLEMAALYSNRNDFDNALRNAREARSLSYTDADKAEAMLELGSVYRKAGGMPEAEKYLDSAYVSFRSLYAQYPERYGQVFCSAIEAYAAVQRWYDRNTRYQQLLEEKVSVLNFLCRYGFVPHRFSLAQTYFDLGHKFMNMDVKIAPAEQSWQKADSLLQALIQENVVLAGDLYVDNNYKLAGCKSAFNKTAEAKAYFLKSLDVRRRLYATAPQAFAHDLATVLVQNANFDANEKRFPEAVDKMNEAAAMAKESGDERMLEEVVNFRDFLKNKIKK